MHYAKGLGLLIFVSFGKILIHRNMNLKVKTNILEEPVVSIFTEGGGSSSLEMLVAPRRQHGINIQKTTIQICTVVRNLYNVT